MEANQSSSEILLQEIQTQSQTEADAIIEQAQKEAEQVRKQSEKEAEQIRHDMLQKAETQAENIRRKILSGVHLEVKKQTLRLRETTISKIVDAIRQKAEALRQSPEYLSNLKDMVLEGVQALDSNAIEIIPGNIERKLLTDDELKKIVNESKKSDLKLALSKDTLEESGIIIESEDGRTRYDNRFEAKLKRNNDTIRLTILKEIMDT